jgi:hypothetical protein
MAAMINAPTIRLTCEILAEQNRPGEPTVFGTHNWRSVLAPEARDRAIMCGVAHRCRATFDGARLRRHRVYWATTTFSVSGWSDDLAGALRAWADHIKITHPKIAETRCYRFNGGATIVWQEGFADFHYYQELIEEEDDVCADVMANVFAHMVPGTRRSQIWSDGI